MTKFSNLLHSKPTSYLIYPITLLITVTIYTVWSHVSNPVISAFGSVIVGLAAIALFEYLAPNRTDWRPVWSDVSNDLLYILLIQILLPRLLGFSIAMMLADKMGEHAPLAALWPREWPLASQAILLILIADFLRYWLHRLSHTWPVLWRLHAVHHSPNHLYWLNTSRFHPIEKTFQFFLDTLPFILMGVDIRIIGFWFVIYSVNGFFQHSNIQLHFAWLSNIFSTAEMHRWHHSLKPEESNANYANVLILWDRLFGSYFRPRNRDVNQLGLRNSAYPMGFFDQMKTPFVANLDQQQLPLPKAQDLLLNLLLSGRMLITHLTHWRRLRQAANNPEQAQLKLLRHILKKNAATEYGLTHRFQDVSSYADFSEIVPICDYEMLRTCIEKQRNTSLPVLTSAQPVIYNTTSGTTGKPKFIPIVPDEIKAQYRHGLLLTYCQYAFDPSAFKGKIWAIASPAVEGTFENDVPWGSASGLLYANMSKYIAKKYLIPAEIFEIENHDMKYQLILRLALAEKNITYLTCANPSTILKLGALVNSKWECFLKDIAQGTFSRLDELPTQIANIAQKHLLADLARATELRKIFSTTKVVTFADLWPSLKLVSTWTFGNCAVPLASVRQQLPKSCNITELGYLSSEFRGSLTVDFEHGGGLPTIQDCFFEFIETEDWERGNRNFHMLHELENNKDYYIVITTASGLYRYFMNDIVSMAGKFSQTPKLHFVQKGKGITNITGEKIHEAQVIEALQRVKNKFLISPLFFIMCADVHNQTYYLFLEISSRDTNLNETELAHFLDAILSELNIEYANKLKSGRLNPLIIRFLQTDSADAYRDFCIASGQKEAQYKPLVLQYLHECKFDFSLYTTGNYHGN